MTASPVTDAPDYLYYYTSLDTLALILKNHTLRLMPLFGMDDVEENIASDAKDFGRLMFASCWTDDAEESIPMWKMYSSLEAGVRIGLPPMPFVTEKLSVEDVRQLLGIPEEFNNSGQINGDCIVPKGLPNFHDTGVITYVQSLIGISDMLFKVTYTDDEELLHPKLLNSNLDDDSYSINPSTFGRCKNTHWAFEREWRYCLWTLPIDASRIANIGWKLYRPELFNSIQAGTIASPLSYLDLELDLEKMRKMKIIASPKMSAGNLILLDSLLNSFEEKNHFRLAYKRSVLTDKIR